MNPPPSARSRPQVLTSLCKGVLTRDTILSAPVAHTPLTGGTGMAAGERYARVPEEGVQGGDHHAAQQERAAEGLLGEEEEDPGVVPELSDRGGRSSEYNKKPRVAE